jgi:hypothetical protein
MSCNYCVEQPLHRLVAFTHTRGHYS